MICKGRNAFHCLKAGAAMAAILAAVSLSPVAGAAEQGNWVPTWAASPQPVWEPDFFAGVGIPRYPFTGSIYKWAAARGLALSPAARPEAGEMVLYGTGPQNAFTSVHVGIVAQVWPDGAITTIEGDSGPEPTGHYAVTINGPFLPAFSQQYNDTPVYAFVRS